MEAQQRGKKMEYEKKNSFNVCIFFISHNGPMDYLKGAIERVKKNRRVLLCNVPYGNCDANRVLVQLRG